VNKISMANSNDIINDKYFSFSNTEIANQQLEALQRKTGINVLNTSEAINTTVPFESVQEMNQIVSQTTGTSQLQQVVNSQMDKIGNFVGSQTTNPQDANTAKMNFFQQLINNLTSCVMDAILSPKVITIFVINFKIVYGQNADFSDPIDFLKKNKNLVSGLIKSIEAIIIKLLLVFVLKEIAKLVAASAAKKQLDKNKLEVAQLLSMVGVPSSTLSILTQIL